MIRGVIAYYRAWRREKAKETVFRSYVADALRVVTENTAKFVGGQYLTSRYADLVREKKPEKKPEKSGKQIANDIISRLCE